MGGGQVPIDKAEMLFNCLSLLGLYNILQRDSIPEALGADLQSAHCSVCLEYTGFATSGQEALF